jgi:hypothetical protein
MGKFTQFNFGPSPGASPVKISPDALLLAGLNMPVEISTASIYRQSRQPPQFTSFTVMGHFDTGASRTYIDINLAKHLGLKPEGESVTHTANGPVKMPDFIINLGFLGYSLSGVSNLRIGSCILRFDLLKNQAKPMNPKNFGLLLGRDLMSRWHIAWDGPSSSVFIYD